VAAWQLEAVAQVILTTHPPYWL